MKTSRSYPLGLPIAALLAVGLSFQSPGPTDSLAGVVGVVDAGRVFNEYPAAVDGRARLAALGSQLKAALSEQDDLIKQTQLEIMSLTEGSQEWELKNVELQAARLRLQGQNDVFERRMGAEARNFSTEMYRVIWEAVGEVAEAKGLQLVLRLQQEPSEMRTVLHTIPELDITQEVINHLKAKD